MASTLKHLRSSTADKRPTASGLVDGQLAINTASGTPALFFKDNNGGVVKVGPAHVGSTAPNAVPAGSAGNSLGELWVDNGLTTPGLNYYTGSAFVNLTPSGTTTTVGLVELATPAETQTGTDAVRAVTPSGLQSKVSDSTSTTSSTTIASSTAVKSAYDLANAALPKAGGTVTGELLIGNTGSLVFEGSSDDSFETTIAVVDPTGDRTITFPNVTGTVVTTGDSGTVTSTMIANDTIVNADINSAAAIAYSKLALSSGIVNTDISASAAIVDTKLATISTADKVSISALDIDGATDIGGALEGGDLFVVDDGAGGTNRKAPAFRMSQLVYSGVTGDIAIASGGTASISAGVIVNADINSSAAIDFSKLASLASANILLGNASNVATSTAVTGDVTISNTGVTAIASGAIVDADISASAEIAVSKLADGAARQLLQTDAAGTGVEWASNIDIPGTLDVTSAATFDSTIGASAGTASLPSITFTGDLNTGIYSPGADQVAISTNGQGRLFVNSGGAVGIGTTPGSFGLLDVTSDSSAWGINLRGRSADNLGFIRFSSNNAVTGYASIGTPAANTLSFDVNGSERLRITSAGLVGVGTSAPLSNLHIAGTTGLRITGIPDKVTPGIYLPTGGILGDINDTFEIRNGGGSSSELRLSSRGKVSIFTAGSGDLGTGGERLTITSGGLVGVGTTSPSALLTVGAAYGGTPNSESRTVIQSAGNSYLTIGAGSSSQAGLLFADTAANNAGGILYTHSSDSLEFVAAGNERARIDSSGRLGIGTSSPGELLDVAGSIRQTGNTAGTANTVGLIDFYNANNTTTIARVNVRTDGAANSGSYRISTANAGTLNEVVRITSGGLVGIGSTSDPGAMGARLWLDSTTDSYFTVNTTGSGSVSGINFRNSNANGEARFVNNTGGPLTFYRSVGNEAARIDSSGRLLVGTSSARSNVYNTTYAPQIQLEGNDNANSALSIISCFNGTSIGGQLILGKANSGSVGVNGIVASGNPLGRLSFQGNDGSEFVEGAAIVAEVDGTPGANDMPGRLVFSTTADGASSPTERMRIGNDGWLYVGTTSKTLYAAVGSTTGLTFSPGELGVASSGTNVLYLNRTVNDGELVGFFQDGTKEGTISVSGTTVSYNGAHLSRWSQLPSGQERTEILRGTVLSNIDEMCEWGEEENEQLNRMKVSDVEGDKNVSGVFQAWDDDDDTYTNDFYCAMTGDFIIRIAGDVTVERGDLLMSAGDGTAKPQDDDIIRSKTIAKVTSTNVSCTYEDGSYCVPCVLMAC